MMAEHDDSSRRVIHATLCEPGAESLRAFCVQHGVTITAFLDALGHSMGTFIAITDPDLHVMAPVLAEALLHARQIDADRRSRVR